MQNLGSCDACPLPGTLGKVTAMKRVCAWCGKGMGTVAGSKHPDDVLSHGICESCVDNLTFQLGAPLETYLDSMPLPVLVVDGHNIVKAVNEKGCKVLGKERREIVQHLGGNVFECAHARLPEGCGRTVHCSGCAIRRSIMRTYETGESQSMVPATLSRGEDDDASAVALTITTVKMGDLVLLRVDQMEEQGSSGQKIAEKRSSDR